MNKLLLLLPLVFLLAGCPATDAGDHPTDGGLWTLDVETEWATGWQDVDFTVLDPDGVAQPDLAIEIDVQMPAMGHGSDEDLTFSELGDGGYRVRVHFQMEGAWELSGTIDDGAQTDTFAIDLDVVAE